MNYNLSKKPLATILQSGNYSDADILECIAAGADPNGSRNALPYEETPLEAAIKSGCSLVVVRALIQAGADIGGKGRWTSPLFFAIEKCNEAAALELINAGAHVDGQVIGAAVERGMKDVLRALVKAGGDVNSEYNPCGITYRPIQVVRDVPMFQLLVELGAELKPFDGHACRDTLLHSFIGNSEKNYSGSSQGLEGRSYELIKELLRHDVELDALVTDSYDGNYKFITPMHLAAERGDAKIVRMLLEAGASATGMNTKIYKAVRKEARCSSSDFKLTPLHVANGKEVVEALLPGSNVHGCSESGFYPLQSVINRGRDLDTVKALLDAGADVNARGKVTMKWWSGSGKLSRPALLLAIERNKLDVAQLLIDAGADVNAKDHNGCTPIFAARTKEAVKMLVAAGADLTVKNIYKQNPIVCALSCYYDIFGSSHALRGSDIKYIRALMRAGADPNEKDKNKKNAFDYVAEFVERRKKVNTSALLKLLRGIF